MSAKFGDIAKGIDGIIVGGESGPKARPINPNWVTLVRDQCAEAGVPFYFKQWGEWVPGFSDGQGYYHFQNNSWGNDCGRPVHCWNNEKSIISVKVGKKEAGRLLNGREYNALPWGNNAERT